MSLSVGDTAPDFSLPDQDKQVVSLAELRGAPVLVVFYPFAFSGICTGELCQLRDELAVYTDAGVRVVAVSTDPTFTLKAWREQQGFEFPLLSDFWPHGATAQAYGVFNDKAGMALRGTPVLLVFYPFAFSGLCTGELCQLRDELSVYTDAGVTVPSASSRNVARNAMPALSLKTP